VSTLAAEPAVRRMSVERGGSSAAGHGAVAEPLPYRLDGAGGEPTLDEVLASAWERLAVHTTVECPICGGPMEPEYAAHALPIGGRCTSCRSGLS
jgi:hypothetical protein